MGDENHLSFWRTLQTSHEGYRNYSELRRKLNVVPLQSDTIWERTRLRLFQFSLRASLANWLLNGLLRILTTWEDPTTRFLAQFFSPRRTAKLRNDILMFQQHHGESLSEA
ncbi:zinc finger, CCHC-type containing protein [Tanacetum coccineum]